MRGDLVILCIILAIWAFVVCIVRDSDRWIKHKRRYVTEREHIQLDESLALTLYERARTTVGKIIDELPEELKAEAVQVPCLFRDWSHSTARPALGHYLGYFKNHVRIRPGPIVIYVGEIHEYATETGKDFEHEVRVTYLHEFAHHLGWDEEEIRRRGFG